MNWWLPPNASTFGGDVDQLFTVVLVITGIAFVLTQGALVYFLFRYRAREGGRAVYVRGSAPLELTWTVLPGLILFVLAVYQYGTWTNIKQVFPLPEESVQMRLEPKQFEWLVFYPGADGQFDTADDITATNLMHVPVNEKILVTLEAQDVIHSLFIPQLRVKQDALPGTTTQVWFEVTEAGTYEVACTELCGLGHYRMGARLIAEPRADFEAWLAERAAAAPSGPERIAGRGR